MGRSLMLILNGGKNNQMPLQETIYLTLDEMEDRNLDDYVSKKFDSSEEVRKFYAHKIDPFLEQHKAYVERVKESTGKNFRGAIVITELDDNLMLERKKVLYKKDIKVFRQITNNKKFLMALQKRDYINYHSAKNNNKSYIPLFSKFIRKELCFHSESESQFRRLAAYWRNSIKSSHYYYDMIRRVLDEYENRYKELGLDSPDVVYSKYKDNLKQKNKPEKVVELEEELDVLEQMKIEDRLGKDMILHQLDYEQPERFKTYADEDGYPGDLEPLSDSLIKKEEIPFNFGSNPLQQPSTSEPERFKTHADEYGYPGDLENWLTDIIKEEDEGISRGKTKTLNNSHHQLFDYES